MKRIMALALCFLLVVPVLCVSVFASEVEYYEFEYFPSVSEFSDSFDSELDGSDSMGYARYLLEDFVPEGSYRIFLFEGSNLYFDFGVCDIVYAPSDDNGFDLEWKVYGKDYSDFKISFELFSDSSTSTSVFSYTRWGLAHFPDLDLPSSSIRLVPVEVDVPSDSSPLSPVQESMSSVLEWVGTVTTSLLSGELNPLLLLLAIPIAISLIFLAIKAIKMVFNF